MPGHANIFNQEEQTNEKENDGKIRGGILASLLADESGQGLVEYVIIMGLVALATTFGLSSVGKGTDNTFTEIQSGYSDSHEVVFQDENGERISRRFYSSYDPIVMPQAPEKDNATFLGWSLDGENVATEDEIKAKIADNSGRVVVTPIYAEEIGNIEPDSTVYTLALNNGERTYYVRVPEEMTTRTLTGEDGGSRTIVEGVKVSDIIPPAKTESVFDSWYSDAALTETVNPNLQLNTFLSSPIRLFAKYNPADDYHYSKDEVAAFFEDEESTCSACGLHHHTAPECKKESNGLFLGWYKDVSYKQPILDASEIPEGGAYAKFIPTNSLGLTVQFRVPAKSGQTDRTDLRLIATVPDSALYSAVGFKVEALRNNEWRQIIDEHYSDSIYTDYVVQTMTGSTSRFTLADALAAHVGNAEWSTRITCCAVLNMPNSYYVGTQTQFKVTQYIITKDNTRSEIETKEFSITEGSDGYPIAIWPNT